MNDRDKFAAAALTGWLASQQTVLSARAMASHAYEYADAMLAARGDTLRSAHAACSDESKLTLTDAERVAVELSRGLCEARREYWSADVLSAMLARAARGTTAHDAAPAAVPAEPAAGEVHEEGAASGTGDTREWRRGQIYGRFVVAASHYALCDPGPRAGVYFDRLCKVVDDIVGSYAAPPAAGVTLTDAERELLEVLVVELPDDDSSTLRGLLARAAKEPTR